MNSGDSGQCWRFGYDPLGKMLNGLYSPTYLNVYAIHSIVDPAFELHFQCQAVNKGTESNTLYLSLDVQVQRCHCHKLRLQLLGFGYNPQTLQGQHWINMVKIILQRRKYPR